MSQKQQQLHHPMSNNRTTPSVGEFTFPFLLIVSLIIRTLLLCRAAPPLHKVANAKARHLSSIIDGGEAMTRACRTTLKPCVVFLSPFIYPSEVGILALLINQKPSGLVSLSTSHFRSGPVPCSLSEPLPPAIPSPLGRRPLHS